MHEIHFSVPLSGSQLFDFHSYMMAKHICDVFPLQFRIDKDEKRIYITGQLNDTWYEQWCKAVFSIGESAALGF